MLLASDLPQITKSLTVAGAGMNKTTIDGAGQWSTFGFESLQDKLAVVSDLKVQGYNAGAITGLDGHTDFTISRVEVDGSNATSNAPFFGGIVLVASGASTLSNLYIHDIVSNIADVGTAGVAIITGGNFSGSASISNTTIENIGATQLSNASSDGITVLSGVIDGSFTPATLNLDVTNSTITHIHSAASGVSGIGVVGVVNNGTTLINVVAKNNTITDLAGSTSIYADPAIFTLTGGAVQGSDSVTINYESSNNILYSKNSSAQNCSFKDVSSLLPDASGEVHFNITSQGGNLSGDNSCSPYLNKSTDQNNISNLDTTLGALSGNGGFVPTIALLQGSPAIDSGVTVAGLTTDARLTVRPQGSSYDSGAYESPYTKPAQAAEGLAGTGQNTALYSIAAILMLTLAAGIVLFNKSVAD